VAGPNLETPEGGAPRGGLVLSALENCKLSQGYRRPRRLALQWNRGLVTSRMPLSQR